MSSLERHDDFDEPALDVADLDPDPFAQFALWLAEVEERDVVEPNAMVLSTVDADGAPSSRSVLLKGLLTGAHGHDGDVFEFVTNGHSRKARALAEEQRVSLLFPWYPLHRQVIIEGSAALAPPELSDQYWATRPRGSQLGAWASDQSSPIADRATLDARVIEVTAQFPDGSPVPRPEHWGAWLVTPSSIEFWQGRPSRVHDRLVYRRSTPSSAWTIERLQP